MYGLTSCVYHTSADHDAVAVVGDKPIILNLEHMVEQKKYNKKTTRKYHFNTKGLEWSNHAMD